MPRRVCESLLRYCEHCWHSSQRILILLVQVHTTPDGHHHPFPAPVMMTIPCPIRSKHAKICSMYSE